MVEERERVVESRDFAYKPRRGRTLKMEIWETETAAGQPGFPF